MKVLSIWQPWASLIAHGHKSIETRGWPAPRSIIGKTIGIASTKVINTEQRRLVREPDFARHYATTSLPDLDELPLGSLLGTVVMEACDPIDSKMIDGLTDQERAFGWYSEGRYAWRLADPRRLATPVAVIGKQGLRDWHNDEHWSGA